MVQKARCDLRQPRDVDALRGMFEQARRQGRTIGLRGAGRSYGDAALNDGGLLLDLTELNRLSSFDPSSGVLVGEPGVTLRQCWREMVPQGHWPAVVSGTMKTTLGGGASMNIHGKNNYCAGSFGEYLESFEILLPTGEELRCSRDENADLFFGAIGGFGMLGCFTSLTMRAKQVESGRVEVRPHATSSFAETLELYDALAPQADYLVGWHDGLSTGAKRGRGLVHEARHLSADEDREAESSMALDRQDLPTRMFGVMPKSWLWMGLWCFLNRPGMRLVNAMKFWSGSRQAQGDPYRQAHAAYHFLLDYVPHWKWAYRPGGLIQFQAFVPREKAASTFDDLLETMHAHGIPPYLCVSKKHRQDPFLMTHAVDGYSLALDIKVSDSNRERVWALTEELEEQVLSAQGRFYFAKDSVLRPRNLTRMYRPETLDAFVALKRRCDPEVMLQTDLYRRIFSQS